MQRSTLALLALLVALLVALWWWQSERERRLARDNDVPLFEGLSFDAVDAVRIDNVERDVHLRAERDESGRWRLVDPLDVPADDAVFDFLVRTAIDRRGTVVPAQEADARALGLEPPRVVLELIDTQGDGATVKRRLEIGALDLDGMRVHVRAAGRILRTLRDIDTTLARPLEGFRSHQVLAIAARDIVEIQRSGAVAFERDEATLDLALDALAEDGDWRATAPVSAALDPTAMYLWVQGCTRLEVERFVEDGGAALADYGLAPPEVTVNLVTVRGDRHALHFGRPAHAVGSRWFARRDDEPAVFEVADGLIRLLCTSTLDLLDHRLVRLATDAIDGVTLHARDRELLLARVGKKWSVSEKRDGFFTTPAEADAGRVGDLLGRLDAVEFTGFAPERTFTPSPGAEAIAVRAGDVSHGGVFGIPVEVADGARAHEFQRPGDALVALVEPTLIDVVHTPIEEFLSARLIDVLEVDQTQLRLAGRGAERRFTRGARSVWMREGTTSEAKELWKVLDGLLIVRAEKHRVAGPQPPLEDPITVEFTNRAGATTSYTVGRVSGREETDGSVVEVDVGGRRALLKDQALHERLSQLLEGV